MAIDLKEKMETRRDGLLFFIFLEIVSFWAFIKYIFFHYLIGMGTENIRRKFYASLLVDRFSEVNRKIRLNATNWRPLDELYNFKNRKPNYSRLEKFLSNIWMRTENAQAARNRARIVRQVIFEEIGKKLNRWRNGTIKILSIASGSAQPLLEAISLLNPEDQKKIAITLLDLDQSALKNSQKFYKNLGLKTKLELKHGSASGLKDFFQENTFDFVEMVGFLDYRPKERAIALIKRIRSILKDEGVFLTCNIFPNREKFFLDWVLLWPMIYRNDDEFAKLIYRSGFSKEKVRIFFEPLRVHIMAICFK